MSASSTAICLLVALMQAGGDELVENSHFRQRDSAEAARAWTAWSPQWAPAACAVRATDDGLLIEAPGRAAAVGGVTQDLRGIRGGQAYALEADGRAGDLRWPGRSLLVRLHWLRQGRPLHPAGWLVRGPAMDGDRFRFHDVLVAPADADGARITLEVKWPEGAPVLWRQVSLRQSEPPQPRKVKIGTVYLRPSGSTPEKNLDLWCAQIDEAGRLGLDAVCLGEAITVVGTGKRATDVAEPIPGPASNRLAEAAARNRLWVVAGLTQREGDQLYNTAVLIDRQGKLAGTYRKTHLPREEWQQGITPGTDYPVFQTDFGTVAVQICYDWFFPEPASIFALKGAEVLFAPTWGNTLPDRDGQIDGESTFRVRARDNGLVLVPSVYDGDSMVIDAMGRIVADSQGKTGVFWAEIDLADRQRLDWVGHWRSIGPRDRMPETYGPLVE